MPRSKLTPEERAARKKERAEARKLARREAKKQGASSPSAKSSRSRSPSPSTPFVRDEHEWLRRAVSLRFAERIINGHTERPYWLSIPHAKGEGTPPVAHVYPCTIFRTSTRAYYGFLFREHRELVVGRWDNARRELTDRIALVHPTLQK